jgi:hypothetical protein
MDLDGKPFRFYPLHLERRMLKMHNIPCYPLDVIIGLRIPLIVLLSDGPESTVQIDAVPPAAPMHQEIVSHAITTGL